MAKTKSRANGDGDVFPRKNAAGRITSYRGAYFGSDGKRRYVSGRTKEAALRAERNRVARAVEQEVEQSAAEARQELEHLQNEDPSQLLNATELESASARREFVNDDVMALSETDLVSRLGSVLASGDRASMYLFWQSARRKKSEIVERRGEQPYELNQALDRLQTALRGPSHKGRVSAVEHSALMSSGGLRSFLGRYSVVVGTSARSTVGKPTGTSRRGSGSSEDKHTSDIPCPRSYDAIIYRIGDARFSLR